MSSNAEDTQPEAVAGVESVPPAREATAVEMGTVTGPDAGMVAASSADATDATGAADATDVAAGAEEGAAAGSAATAEPIELGDVGDRGDLGDLDEPVQLAEPVTVHEGGRRWQRVLIAVSFVIVALAVVGGAIAIIGSLTHGFKKPVQITYKKSAIFSLKTGDCLDPQGSQSYTLVACDKPHGAEVFGTFELPAGKWAGTTATRAAASSGCATRLTGYLNPQLAISLATTYVFPDSVAWQAGTRTVICEVQATSGQLSQSVRGASAG